MNISNYNTTMKNITTILFSLFICLCGCNNNPKKSNVISEDEYQKMLQESGTIAVPATFMPTLELTDEIRESSLEDLIIQNKGKYSAIEEEKREEYINKIIKESRQQAILEGRKFTKEDEAFIREFEAKFERPMSPIEMSLYSGVTLKHLPQTSNIAKVFYMEKKESFIVYNKDFYYRVIRKQQSSHQEEREKAAQERWKEYD